MSNTRTSGFYWVYKDFEWEVALWQKEYKSWSLPGVQEIYHNRDFLKINETPLLPPKE